MATGAANIAKKLDMSLDELIERSRPTPRQRPNFARANIQDGSFRPSFGQGRFRNRFPSRRVELDDGNFRRRNRDFDLIGKGRSTFQRVPRGNWRGGRGGGRFTTPRAFYREDEVVDVDMEEAMSDGEIPTLPSARRQLIVESRRRRSASLSRETNQGRYVRISDLDYSILESDLQELFTSVGPIKKCWIDYDATDRSLGTGGVIFVSPRDAREAVNEFDARLIDGQPIRLEIVRPRSSWY